MQKLVTRDSLAQMLRNPNPSYVETVVGRALVALLQRQTKDEQATNDTRVWNSVGFSGADARSGTLTAKSFIKNRGKLQPWQVEKWTKPAKNGYPRLCKYAEQLNQIAVEKQRDAANVREREARITQIHQGMTQGEAFRHIHRSDCE
jgi:hypothetical protein